MNGVSTGTRRSLGRAMDNDLYEHRVKIYKARLASERVVDDASDADAIWREAAEAAARRHPRWAGSSDETTYRRGPSGK